MLYGNRGKPCYFNPRSPRGERLYRTIDYATQEISIHAPRGGSDRKFMHRARIKMIFQSTLPAGERLSQKVR